MKYIRTKELYEVMPKQICNTDKFVEVQRKKVGLFTGTTELISKDDIISQADTIEELCDAFVDTSELKTTNTGGWFSAYAKMLWWCELDVDNRWYNELIKESVD